MLNKLKDPVSGFSHLFGAIMSLVGLVVLVYYAAVTATPWHVVSFSIYGASLILLFTFSTLYHLLFISEKGTLLLRRIDHIMIYVLIAGSYTPICLIPLRGAWGWSLLGSIWGMAIVGIILKVLWFDAPRWLSTLFYAIMGWLVVIAFIPLVRTIPIGGIAWMVSGGIFYSIGALIYGFKWPKINLKYFGFHEIFHLFVLAGSFCHYWLMYRYILFLR